MAGADFHFIAWAYVVAGLVFAGFAVYLAVGWKGARTGIQLLFAVALSALWAISFGAGAYFGQPWIVVLAQVFDFARLGAWGVFLFGLLAVAAPTALAAGRFRVLAVLGGILLVWALLASLPGVAVALPHRWRLFPFLGLAIWMLVMVDQVFFNFPHGSRWGIKPLVLGLAAAFAFDVYQYADAYLFGRVDWELLSIRGLAHAIVMPLVLTSAVRSRDWTFRISVSRDLVFHSAALIGSGGYLLLVSAAGYYVRWFGGSWGGALQTALLFCGLLFLSLVVLSGTIRARTRVFLSKHLFSYRYDYRLAWQKLTQSLGSPAVGRNFEQTAISALGDLVESPGGAILVLEEQSQVLKPAGQLNFRELLPDATLAQDFCDYIREREWIVDLVEWREQPSKYEGMQMPEWLIALSDAWLVIPLIAGDRLHGVVILAFPRTEIDVDWEVRDLLKMAARQVASYLAQTRAVSALLEAQKFDAFNRMSAFVVHDLKNLVAQLALMLKNADRHKDNPEFQADMLMTVENVAARMRGLMEQLQNKKPIEQRRSVELAGLAQGLVAARRRGAVALELVAPQAAWVLAQPERLERVVGHVVQNALEACSEDGKVVVRVSRDDSMARIEVIDSGVGMSAEFIRSRLFRPFQTTKSAGMGIGAFEVQQYVTELGGRVDVASELGHGTNFSLLIPLSNRNDRVEAR